jgi:hypothetical protein
LHGFSTERPISAHPCHIRVGKKIKTDIFGAIILQTYFKATGGGLKQ